MFLLRFRLACLTSTVCSFSSSCFRSFFVRGSCQNIRPCPCRMNIAKTSFNLFVSLIYEHMMWLGPDTARSRFRPLRSYVHGLDLSVTLQCRHLAGPAPSRRPGDDGSLCWTALRFLVLTG